MKYFYFLTAFILSTLTLNAQFTGLTNSLNNYSFDLYNQLKSDNENMFFSPLSTYYALLAAYEGAANETKKEFENVLHIENSESLSNFNDFSKDMISFKDSSNYLNIANALWIQKDFSVQENYIKQVERKYDSEVKSTDFKQNTIAAKEINSWISNKTNKLIKDIINPNNINEFTRLVIANAIFFIGKWDHGFKKQATKPDIFYTINKAETKIDFMHKTEYLYYYENNAFQFISKNYKGRDKSFCIILPKTKYGLAEVEKNFDFATFEDILNNTTNCEVKLTIPKYKLETNYELPEVLKSLGLKKAFSQEADFTGITTEEPLIINKVTHKAYIEINEEKTVAAAATVIRMGEMDLPGSKPPKPKVFIANHPFMFMIIDNSTKGIIFMGRYVQPEKGILSKSKSTVFIFAGISLIVIFLFIYIYIHYLRKKKA